MLPMTQRMNKNADDRLEETRQTHLPVSSASLPQFHDREIISRECCLPVFSCDTNVFVFLFRQLLFFYPAKISGLHFLCWFVDFVSPMSLQKEVSIGQDLGRALKKVYTYKTKSNTNHPQPFGDYFSADQ